MPVLCLLSLISRNSPKQLGMVSPELPETVPLRLMKHIGRCCHERAKDAWRWCDRTVKSVDGSMVSMADTSANQAQYPQSRSQARLPSLIQFWA